MFNLLLQYIYNIFYQKNKHHVSKVGEKTDFDIVIRHNSAIISIYEGKGKVSPLNEKLRKIEYKPNKFKKHAHTH